MWTRDSPSPQGIIFREKHFLLNAKNDKVIREGMTFNLRSADPLPCMWHLPVVCAELRLCSHPDYS